MSVRSAALDRVPLWLWCRLRGGADARRRTAGPPGARRLHAYGVGLGKTGTTSLARVFQNRYRAGHEPGAVFLVAGLERRERGRATERAERRFLAERDRMLALDFESSMFLGPYAGTLARLFPDARFVLTVRDCFSWTESEIGEQLSHTGPGSRCRCVRGAPCAWRRWWRWAYGWGEVHDHPPEEAALAERGVPPLGRYLAAWRRHNEAVLAAVPRDRLLVVRTGEIASRLDEIAAFVGAEAGSLDPSRAHQRARARKALTLADAVGAEYLNRAAERECGGLMRMLFPDVPRAEDALRPAAVS